MRGIISDPSLYNLGQIIVWCCVALLFLFFLLINAIDYFPLRNKFSKKKKRETRIEPEPELELELEKQVEENRKKSQPQSLPTAKKSLQTISFNDIEITNALTLRINNQEVIGEPTVYTCCLETGLNYLIMDFQTEKTVNRLIFFDTFLDDRIKENLHLFLRKLSAVYPSNPLTKEDSWEAYLRIERLIKIQKSQKAIETMLRDKSSVLMSFNSAMEIKDILKKLRKKVCEYCLDILEGSYYATYYSIDVTFLLNHQALQAINNKYKFTEVECVFATRVNAHWMPTVWKVVAETRTYCLITFTPEEFKALSAEVESEITVLKFNAKRMEDNWVNQGEAIAAIRSFITLNENANLEFRKYLLPSEDIDCFHQWYKQVLVRYITSIAKDMENQYFASMTITD
ncbi:MAG: hypothetical protein KHX35_06705 [Sutterella wadsworthensis]|nr:hypothetical protein [Sutterella wadsworthensis]